jgi:pimeloyl-ACP methyl ester carboxylesterase
MVPVDQVAVVLPGAGSSADFVGRAFRRPLREAGYQLVAPEPAPGPDLVRAAFRSLDAAAAEYGARLRLVGGVSLGAHTAARWAAAAGLGLDGVLLALPAWTGAPGAAAAATAASADLVERLGTAGALAAAGTAVSWVAAELAAAWPAYGDRLAASLRAAAAAPGPTRAELAALPVPAGLVAFPDDPLHPAALAHDWAAAIPRAAVRELPLAAPATDRSVLGAATLAALATAHRAGHPSRQPERRKPAQT